MIAHPTSLGLGLEGHMARRSWGTSLIWPRARGTLIMAVLITEASLPPPHSSIPSCLRFYFNPLADAPGTEVPALMFGRTLSMS